jgi:hypothetical protein
MNKIPQGSKKEIAYFLSKSYLHPCFTRPLNKSHYKQLNEECNKLLNANKLTKKEINKLFNRKIKRSKMNKEQVLLALLESSDDFWDLFTRDWLYNVFGADFSSHISKQDLLDEILIIKPDVFEVFGYYMTKKDASDTLKRLSKNDMIWILKEFDDKFTPLEI